MKKINKTAIFDFFFFFANSHFVPSLASFRNFHFYNPILEQIAQLGFSRVSFRGSGGLFWLRNAIIKGEGGKKKLWSIATRTVVSSQAKIQAALSTLPPNRICARRARERKIKRSRDSFLTDG